ncbi:sensor histidine kinase [Mucilaginibacter sabulilitoris]|uniref:Sensor histidine kinase n=1 Tax=Mucilaginibacter sabulilitoris TaxID=1173583 RepID=A0ABZ0TSY6_9SPHI|nr:sensor histidine kinase [Mucilaginibacter sabulilitoris]WPU94580.1 sensor histidine kinase [Mucilaginibacter sabulilitoris]
MSRFRAFSVIIHIAGWLLFMAFPVVFLNSRGQDTPTWSLLQKHSYWMFGYTYAFLFYSNAYYFIPEFFLKKKYAVYAIIVLLLLTGVYYLRPFDKLLHSAGNRRYNPAMSQPSPFAPPPAGNHELGTPPQGDKFSNGGAQQPPPNAMRWGNGRPPFRRNRPLDSTSLFIFIMIMALSTAIKTVQQWQLTERRAAQAEADKTSAELSFLKAQINPHFLFNTLNNIYTLAVTKDDHAADSIMKLSNIMRYVTDDVTDDFVPLQSEIDCISDYIELQRLRIGNNTTVNFTVEGKIDGKKITPLVLMTFVENVFKYGISKHEQSVIDINIRTSNSDILFFCKNRVFATRTENQRTGIGIKNTRQRLNHLYPGRHLLNIWNENDQHSVQLILQT